MKTRNCEVTPQAIEPIVKSLIKRDGPKAPAAIHRPLGLKYQPREKPTMTTECLKINSHRVTCDENRKRQVVVKSSSTA
jgi:hypothetical protein